MDGFNFIGWIEDKWHSDFMPFILFIFGVVVCVFIKHQIPEIQVSLIYWFITAPLLGLLFAFFWLFQHRIPKVPKGCIGLAVAIVPEDGDLRSKNVRDFVVSLREQLEKVRLNDNSFVVLELSKYHASKIKDYETAVKYRLKSRSHFLVYGYSKIRTFKNKPCHAIKLDGIVCHAPTTEENRQNLSQEMSNVLPLKLKVSCENDLTEFESASTCYSESAKFVISTAAILSNDFNLALELMKQLESSIKSLEKLKKTSPSVATLIKKIPTRLTDIYWLLSQQEYFLWRQTRDDHHMNLVKQYVEIFNKRNPGTLDYALLNAIWFFVIKKDLVSALKELKKCSTKYFQSPKWRYSMAFIYALNSDLDNAEKNYEAAFLLDDSYETGFEIEEFIDWALSIYPQKYQLRYCMGLINLNLKKDNELANIEFKGFIEADSTNQFPEAKQKALAYIEKIQTGKTIK